MKTPSYLLLLLALAIGGCRQQQPPQKPEKPSPQAMLHKIIALEAWGDCEAAGQWYRQLTNDSFPHEIRYQAFARLLKLLQRQGKKHEAATLQENMLAVFPEQADKIRQQLWQYYIAAWQWPKLEKLIQQTRPKDLADDRKRQDWLRRIKQWSQPQTIWEERFYNLDHWALAHPFYYKVDSYTRCLEAKTITGGWYHVGKIFHWQGDSTCIDCDVQIVSIDWSGELRFGIFSLTDNDCLVARFSCGGGTGDLNYSLDLQGSAAKQPARRLTFTLDGYNLKIWYRLTIDYRAEIGQARLLLRNRENKRLLGQCIIKFVKGFAPGQYAIGVAPSQKIPGLPSRFARVQIDNIGLHGGHWQKPQQQPPLQVIYKINRWFRTKPILALKYCDRVLEHSPDFLKALETRALLALAIRQPRRAIHDLKELLKRDPRHDNRDHFIQVIKRLR